MKSLSMGIFKWLKADDDASTETAADSKRQLDSTIRPKCRPSDQPPSVSFRQTTSRQPVASALYRQWDDEEDPTRSFPSSRMLGASRPRLRVLTGISSGAVISLDDKKIFLLGRTGDADIQIDDAGVSRIHCRLVRRGESFYVEDLGSMNGTLLNGIRVTSAEMRSGDRIQIGSNAIVQFVLLDATTDTLARHVFDTETRDSLTRAYNRRYFSERLNSEITQARTSDHPLSVMLLDLDKFRALNDSAGRGAGDIALRSVVDELSRALRLEDVLTRYGGDEVAVLVPATPRGDAAIVAERLRSRVQSLRITVGTKIVGVTVSIGIAELSECHGTASGDDLLALAARRVHRAKLLGRNRVCAE
jgi:two-component system, cell cycle response regulator